MAKPPKAPPGKPGRPRIKHYDSDKWDQAFPHLSERARQNRFYGMMAVDWLGISHQSGGIKVPARYRYLIPVDDIYRRDVKWDVLAELGRIRFTVALKIFADRICKLKPPAKQAVALIREWRRTFEYWVVSDIQTGSYSWMIRQARLSGVTGVTDVPPKIKRKVIAFITATAHAICDGRALPEIMQRPAGFRLSWAPANVREIMDWMWALVSLDSQKESEPGAP